MFSCGSGRKCAESADALPILCPAPNLVSNSSEGHDFDRRHSLQQPKVPMALSRSTQESIRKTLSTAVFSFNRLTGPKLPRR